MGPFLMIRSAEASAVSRSIDPLDALGGIEARVALARGRIEEIDRLLTMPEFSEDAAKGRAVELEARGDGRAAALARARVESIRSLRSLRERFSRELDEVGELMARLRVQSDLSRLSGTPFEAIEDLASELVGRLEGLDAIIAAETAIGSDESSAEAR
jgi:hypothetical protein